MLFIDHVLVHVSLMKMNCRLALLRSAMDLRVQYLGLARGYGLSLLCSDLYDELGMLSSGIACRRSFKYGA